jgi:hypothetical protein
MSQGKTWHKWTSSFNTESQQRYNICAISKLLDSRIVSIDNPIRPTTFDTFSILGVDEGRLQSQFRGNPSQAGDHGRRRR